MYINQLRARPILDATVGGLWRPTMIPAALSHMILQTRCALFTIAIVGGLRGRTFKKPPRWGSIPFRWLDKRQAALPAASFMESYALAIGKVARTIVPF